MEGFDSWRKAVEAIMQSRFGLDLSDIGMGAEDLLGHYRTWPEPSDFCNWFGDKYDLTDRHQLLSFR